ncbi:hypothetical protein TH25_11605 [Thalassospira profundimaris]|uniref:Uncharacterized protein n=1 Tax=Thalassospira profundimaris TaxID=502049 RepID=A0A367X9B5_9PROT|nr:hypothetical protein [Thalassospira profundimaris]RCK50253.1 hypothetical protein TH25_11605 [Thalassospira profundimaris]
MKISSISEISLGFSLVAFCLSVVHEWFYFHAIGGGMWALMSVWDFLNLSLLWLPLAIGMILLWFFIMAFGSIILINLKGWFSGVAKFLGISFKSPRGYYKFNFLFSVFFKFFVSSFLIVISFLFIFVLEMNVVDYFIFGAFVWLLFMVFVSDEGGWLKQLPKPWKPVFILLPVVFAVVAYVGDLEARRDAVAKKGNVLVQFKDGVQMTDVLLLRSMERGVLIRSPEQKFLGMVDWGDVRYVKIAKDGTK